MNLIIKVNFCLKFNQKFLKKDLQIVHIMIQYFKDSFLRRIKLLSPIVWVSQFDGKT